MSGIYIKITLWVISKHLAIDYYWGLIELINFD